jgi:uncharacterized protein YkwD
MDSAQTVYSLNELTLTIDLTGKDRVLVSLYHKEFGDEDHPLPAVFMGSANGDGVSISEDGATWYRVQGLTVYDGVSSAWKRYEVDLDAAAASAGIDYNGSFKIKFQQYDNGPVPTDGFAWDEISVAPDDGGSDDPTLLPEESELIRLINEARAQNNLSALRSVAALNTAARRHSNDMAQKNFMSHTGSDGSSPWDRMVQVGYHMTAGGENVGAGYSTPAAMFNGWMSSAGHRANILRNFCDMGVGYAYSGSSSYGHYWTLDLGCQ